MSKMSDLPQSLQDVAEVIGLEKAIIISRLYGGKRLFVPIGQFPASHPLNNLIGEQSLKLLCQYFGGCLLEICKPDKAILADRNRELIKDRQAGVTIPGLASKYGLTERWVRVILHSEPKPERSAVQSNVVQMDLFRQQDPLGGRNSQRLD